MKVFARPLALVLLFALPASAQMTVSGRVTDGTGAPVQDATVSVPALSISTRTGVDGRYAFIIRSAQVMGQTVNITARHSRYGTQLVQIRIVGGALEQDFVLQAPQRPVPVQIPRDTGGRGMPPAVGPPAPGAGLPASVSPGLMVGFDATAPVDFPAALAGRHASLHVDPATTPDGFSPMLYRGARSFFNNTQPLVVVDGVPVDNVGFTTTSQRFGQGGFDFGSPLNDIALDDVASVTLLDPVTAAMRYGSRAANGVLDVRTKQGTGIVAGFAVTASTRYSRQSATRLPAYQNQFGQGLGGQFEFFDGQGGGINDAIAQNWGPRLDARPLPQHSLTEPRRPDVRHWLPQPDDIANYYATAGTVDGNVTLVGTVPASQLRLSLSARRAAGLTPDAEMRRLGVNLSGATRIANRLTAALNAQLSGAFADQRPGTGFDEINPVSGFTRLGRQVDLDALRTSVTATSGSQINWIYTNRNNPFVATTRNSNESDRRHLMAGLSLRYDIAPWLAGTLNAATDDWTETRLVRIGSGWLGGYPSTLGRADFSAGGSDDQTVGAAERVFTLGLDARRERATGWSMRGAASGELRTNEFKTTAVVTDGPPAGESAVANLKREGSHDETAFVVSGGVSRGAIGLDGGARLEQSSSLARSFSAVFPSARLTYDVGRGIPAVRDALGLGDTRLVARWWKAGNEITRRMLATTYFGGIPVAAEEDVTGPERTQGLELGLTVQSPGMRFGGELVAYRERSTDLLVAAVPGDGSVALAQAGQIFNGGLHLLLSGTLLQNWHGLEGGARLSVARNRSTVDAVHPSASHVQVTPDLFGAQLGARVGFEAGVILGSRYLRAADGALVLRNGLPLADAATGLSVLGSVSPDLSFSLDNRWSYRGVQLYVLLDARVGGKVFSATNLWGSYAGSLENTLVGDRAPGAASGDSLVIAGVDSVTGAANTTKVSAEQYFHALGAIAERWVYDASATTLREARISYEVPTRFVPGFRAHRLRLALIGRNLVTWTDAPNVNPSFGMGGMRGFEMGQLPGSRALGVEFSIAP